jgi:hypothetical protein
MQENKPTKGKPDVTVILSNVCDMKKARGKYCHYCLGKMRRLGQDGSLFKVTKKAIENITSIPIGRMIITGLTGNPPENPEFHSFIKRVCASDNRPENINVLMNSCVGTSKERVMEFVKKTVAAAKGVPVSLLISAGPMHAGLTPKEEGTASNDDPRVAAHRKEIENIHEVTEEIEKRLREKYLKKHGKKAATAFAAGLQHQFLVRSYEQPTRMDEVWSDLDPNLSEWEKGQYLLAHCPVYQRTMKKYGIPITRANPSGRYHRLDEFDGPFTIRDENTFVIDADGRYYYLAINEKMTAFGNVHKQPLIDVYKKY